jgi:hypothetical protein
MSLTKATYSMIAGAPVNALDFGADPSGATDSTAAIQAAVDYAYANNSGEVYFPAGTYSITTISLTYTATKTVNIVGAGQKSTFFQKFDNSTTPLFDWSSGTFGEAYTNFKSFYINGNNYTHRGIQLTLCARFYFEDITFSRCSVGLYNFGALLFEVNNCQFKNNLIGYQSVLFGTINKANAVTFNGGCFQGCTQWALDLGAAEGITLNNVNIEQCGTATPPPGQIYGVIAIRSDIDIVTGYGKVTVNECWLEQNGGIGFFMAGPQAFGNGTLSVNNTFIYNTAGGNVATINDGNFYCDNITAASSGDTVTLSCNNTSITNSTIHTLIDTSATKVYQGLGGNFPSIQYEATESFTAKAFVLFNGVPATPTIYRAGNVSSVSKLSTGVYRITFANPMKTANYAVFGSSNEYGAFNQSISIVDSTTTYADIAVGNATTNDHVDNTIVSVCVLF